MIGGIFRLALVFVTLGIAWYTSGAVLATAWRNEPIIGYLGAFGIEGVLGYAIFTIAKTKEKAMIAILILFFGAFSIAAQILHAWVFGIQLSDAIVEKLPAWIVFAWQYVLPSIPTLAGMAVGLLDIAEKSGFHEEEFFKRVADGLNELRGKGKAQGQATAIASDTESLPNSRAPLQ